MCVSGGIVIGIVHSNHLAQLFNHLFDADVPILRDLALHLREPLTQLLVLLIEYRPLVQLFAHLLSAQGKLRVTETGQDRSLGDGGQAEESRGDMRENVW